MLSSLRPKTLVTLLLITVLILSFTSLGAAAQEESARHSGDDDGSIRITKTYVAPAGVNFSNIKAKFRLYTRGSSGYRQKESGEIRGNGSITFDDLDPGDYYLREDDLSGYSSSLSDYTKVTVTRNNQTQINVTNTYNKGLLVINKTYADELEAGVSPQAMFRLYSRSGGYHLLGIITITGENSGSFGILTPGTYYLKEAAPEGYTLEIAGYTKNSDGYYPITVTAGGTTALGAVNTEIPPPPPPPPPEVDLTIHKTYQLEAGSESADNLNAYFRIFTFDGSSMVQLGSVLTITGEGSGTYYGLSPGTYYLTEEPPSGFSYAFPDLVERDGFPGFYEVTLTEGSDRTVEAVNSELPPPPPPQYGTVEITKTFSDGRSPAGVVFRLYPSGSDTAIREGATDEEGKLLFTGLDLSATYTLSEEIPAGYESSLTPNTAVAFEGEDDHVVSIGVANTAVPEPGDNDDDDDDNDNGNDNDDNDDNDNGNDNDDNDDDDNDDDDDDDNGTGGIDDPGNESPGDGDPGDEDPGNGDDGDDGEVTIPDEGTSLDPPLADLPQTGFNAAGYLFTGFALMLLGILLGRTRGKQKSL
ncbi:MAG TPA: SpaA isopeptide-forming pilin-related protein [Candidatus Acidoferrum sp.]|nr:SpaA isopeptide-forming pilin-related protein [Candidatus Acidoferrum sp.]